MENNILFQVKQKANQWLGNDYDEETRNKVKYLLENDEAELIESFYKDLEFGTGGLRGIMGVGTNRMNIYTVGMATQGLSNYLKLNFNHLSEIKVAIAYDCRLNGKLFAETAAEIFSGNGFTVYLFDSLRPTPELSFAIRYLGCQSGIVITASHNPKEYNGYKAYWDDGAQVIAPHDVNIISEVQKITNINQVIFHGEKSKIISIGSEIDDAFLKEVKKLSLSGNSLKNRNNLKIVYTPLHGTGVKLVPKALNEFGFTNIIHVDEQDINDGNFPTVKSPNPEESVALEMAIAKAEQTSADIVLATDPDADRVGVAVKNKDGKFVLLNGNQTAVLLVYYQLLMWHKQKRITGNEYIVKTIVTTELIASIANKFNVEYFDVLTGFKYIADIIRKNEGTKTYIGGGEESYGYLPGDFVRDKDAVSSCALVAEVAAYAMEQSKTLLDLLYDIYVEFGLYFENLVSITKKGKAGAEEIKLMMEDFRNHPPKMINNSEVVLIKDYLKSESFDVQTDNTKKIDLPQSDVLQFFLKNGTKISIRPSGTEPKIKFYIEVNEKLLSHYEIENTLKILNERIVAIKKEMKLL